MPRRAALVVAASLVGSIAAAQSSWIGSPPAITTSLPKDIDLSLLDPPCGCIFTVDGRAAGLRRLTFRAVDRSHALPPVVASIELRVEGGSVNAPILFGDVTGDGVLDAGARLNDRLGM